MIQIGIVGCGRIMAGASAWLSVASRGSVNDFRITALCSLSEDEARMYVRREKAPPNARPSASLPAIRWPWPTKRLRLPRRRRSRVYTDYRRMMAERRLTRSTILQATPCTIRWPKRAWSRQGSSDRKPMAVTVEARGGCANWPSAESGSGRFSKRPLHAPHPAVAMAVRVGTHRPTADDLDGQHRRTLGPRPHRGRHALAPPPPGGGRNLARRACTAST